MLVDTHAHLDSRDFTEDREQVIVRSLAVGVNAIVTVGTDLESSRQAAMLAQQYPSVYAAVGIHPHEAAQAHPDDVAELLPLSAHEKVVAIGEIGLDFYRNLSPADKQREILIAQLALAQRVGKPVIIHDRQAHEETMSILREKAKGLRGVLHCFSGDLNMALKATKMGFYISLAGPVTFQNAHELQALARELPLEYMLIETDCPYLAPHPYRGRRNEPAYVRFIAARIAALKAIPVERVAQVTTENARQLFALK
ncbi:MAG: TatD family hydrolase [Anaerolineae bacterium]